MANTKPIPYGSIDVECEGYCQKPEITRSYQPTSYRPNRIFLALSLFRQGSFASLVLIFLYPSPHLSSPCFLQPQRPIIPFIGKGMKPMFSLRSGLAKMLPPSVKGSSPLKLQTTSQHNRSLTPTIPAIGMVFFLHTPSIPRTHSQNPRVDTSGAL